MSRPVFITEDFLLETEHARRLYHDHAASMPILDFHCHLPPAAIASDQKWLNLTQVWLAGDHYKWRAMRANGVSERCCTGDASEWEKFEKWAATMPFLVRNPLYDWTHLELARYFHISDRLLDRETATGIWDEASRKLSQPELSCRGLMKQSRVTHVCTTDDPVDSLEYHKMIASDASFGVRVLPTWRPDKGVAIEKTGAFNTWVDKLAAAAEIEVRDFESYLAALRKRQAFFHLAGCRLADHGMDTVHAVDYVDSEIDTIFRKVRTGGVAGDDEILKFKSAMTYELGIMNHEKGWAQQFHIGAIRNNNSRAARVLGPDTGYDAIGDSAIARPLAELLDRLDETDQLAKTVLYNINPRDTVMLVSIIGCFQDGSIPGKMQLGSAWWFLDQKDGMERQIDDLSRNGLLSRFVGMVTDSRSFLSFTRHEYFRRILCNILGKDMAAGRIPRDFGLIGGMIRDICYNNAARYFGFDVPLP